jgi:gamma-glutamylcysteine synthetase
MVDFGSECVKMVMTVTNYSEVSIWDHTDMVKTGMLKEVSFHRFSFVSHFTHAFSVNCYGIKELENHSIILLIEMQLIN